MTTIHVLSLGYFFSKIVCLLKRFMIPYIGKKLTFTRLKNQNPKLN